MISALLIGAALAAPSSTELRAAHRAARAADCGPALALSDIPGAPPGKLRTRAAEAQVRCAAATLGPPDPVGFFSEPLAAAALVEPALRRELTTAITLSTRAQLSRVTTSSDTLAALHGLLSAARAVDPGNWMLWEDSLQASVLRGDGVRVQADTLALLTAWSGEPAGAPVVSRFCAESDRHDRERGARILRRCADALAASYAAHPQSVDVITAYLVALEAAAYSADGELRARALSALRQLAPDSALVGLLEARALEAQGERAAARDRYAEVVAMAPDDIEARLGLGVMLAEDALAAYNDPAAPAAESEATAAAAAEHLEVAARSPALRPEEQIVSARLLIQLYDRLGDQAAEDRWRRSYTELLGR